MALSNTEEVNNRCLAMLDKAQEMAGTSPNLDIYKQKILLLMRMNKQAQAADILKEYITLAFGLRRPGHRRNRKGMDQ